MFCFVPLCFSVDLAEVVHAAFVGCVCTMAWITGGMTKEPACGRVVVISSPKRMEVVEGRDGRVRTSKSHCFHEGRVACFFMCTCFSCFSEVVAR